jgi:hypothetical protein
MKAKDFVLLKHPTAMVMKNIIRTSSGKQARYQIRVKDIPVSIGDGKSESSAWVDAKAFIKETEVIKKNLKK